MMLSIQIAKFKICQYEKVRAVSPLLVLCAYAAVQAKKKGQVE